MSTPEKSKQPDEEKEEERYPKHPDKEHGDEVSLPEKPEGNVEIMVERGRQMGF